LGSRSDGAFLLGIQFIRERGGGQPPGNAKRKQQLN
jgi:hypothetical protein